MVSDDTFDRLCGAEIDAADLRIEHLVGSVKELPFEPFLNLLACQAVCRIRRQLQPLAQAA
jgi:hypothetical protein